MATAIGKVQCVKCGKPRSTLKCAGCSQDFCFNHLAEHRQELTTELDHIENDRNLFRQTLTEQTNNPNNNALIKQITEWERTSINKIQQTANQCRQVVIDHLSGNIHRIEVDLNKLTDQLREIRQEDDFNETDLQRLKQELTKLAETLNKPSNIVIKHGSASYINEISVVVTSGEYMIRLCESSSLGDILFSNRSIFFFSDISRQNRLELFVGSAGMCYT